jgi:hypothetical protein
LADTVGPPREIEQSSHPGRVRRRGSWKGSTRRCRR